MLLHGIKRGGLAMRAIKLDYVSPRFPPLAGLGLLLLVGIIFAAGWQYYSAMVGRTRTMEQQIQQLRTESGLKEPARPAQKKSSAELLEKIEQARKLADFLLIPWGDVFAALEAAALDDSALLSIEPDPKKRQVKITAEAKNKDVMFAYIQRLDATPQLAGVYLLKHEIMMDVDQHPIRFVAVARWKEQP